MNQNIINQLIEDGYRPVRLLALYSANVLIQPGEAKEEYAGWIEYPETGPAYKLDGRELTALAETFGLKIYPFRVGTKKGERLQSAKTTEFSLFSRDLILQNVHGDPIQLLFAKETAVSLKLVAFYRDGTCCEASYKGQYDLHFDDNEFKGITHTA